MDGTLECADSHVSGTENETQIQTQQEKNFLVQELLLGLNRSPKTINPKFFYDERGSGLFDQITHLPEYYPTRTETRILQDNADAIANCVGRDAVWIEPGAGSCDKVRYLLGSVQPAAYIPQDISREFLCRTAAELALAFPWLKIQLSIGDFSDGIVLPESMPEGRRIIFYPGSTIGNFEPSEAIQFLQSMRELAGGDGGLVIGVDLEKDPRILNAAYNDAAGVTAEFNRNILRHVNRLLESNIVPENFAHRAFYNAQKHRIEMHLVCTEAHTVDVNGCDQLHFHEGESIHTEDSYKYTIEGFSELAESAGFTLKNSWMDDNKLFSVHYFD